MSGTEASSTDGSPADAQALADELSAMRAALYAIERRLEHLDGGRLERKVSFDDSAEPPSAVSRRHLLRALGGAATAGAALALGSEVLRPAVASAANYGDNQAFILAQGSYAAVEAANNSTGPAINASIITNTSNGAAAVHATTIGVGNAVLASISNTASGNNAVESSTNGLGAALRGEITNSSNSTPATFGATNGSGAGVHGRNTGVGRGVFAEVSSSTNSSAAMSASHAGDGIAVFGVVTKTTSSAAAVYGQTGGTGNGVVGRITLGSANAATAVYGVTNGSGRAVHGDVSSGSATAVLGTTAGSGPGVIATLTSSSNASNALQAATAGTGLACFLDVTKTTNTSPGLRSRHAGTGSAIHALITNGASAAAAIDAQTSGAGVAVSGVSDHGIGLVGQGELAPLLLVPASAVGPPAGGSHRAGEFVVDRDGGLFGCKAGDGTGIGTWARVGFNPFNPVRIVDTRPGNSPDLPGEHALSPGEELIIDIVGGLAAVPLGATAVTINLTAVSPSAPGWLAAYPADLTYSAASPPAFSNVNFLAGVTTANQATVKIAGPGTANSGKIKVFCGFCTTDLIIDVSGFFA